MGQQFVNSAARLAGTFARLWNAAQNAWPADNYHPEAHYMRGPGPKWRAKHAQVRGATFVAKR
jgi:hypothetical protein